MSKIMEDIYTIVYPDFYRNALWTKIDKTILENHIEDVKKHYSNVIIKEWDPEDE